MKFWKSIKSTASVVGSGGGGGGGGGGTLLGRKKSDGGMTTPRSQRRYNESNHKHDTSNNYYHYHRSGSETTTTTTDPIYEDFIYGNNSSNVGTTFVELIKRPGTHLGVIVTGGIDTGMTPKIVDLIPGSWAQRSDVLCIGDVIVSINGISTETMTQRDLVKTLDVSDRIQLEVRYRLPSYRHRSSTKKVTSKAIQVTLKKENGSFGFVIRGGTHDDSRRVRPFTVMNVTPNGMAFREGTIRIHDRILSVNGNSLRNMKLPELQALLYRQDGDTVFTVEYDVAVHDQHEIGRPILVELLRDPSDILGFGLNKCNDSGHVYIESVKQASLAERCGGIHVGDILCSVNGQSLARISDVDAILDMIRSGKNGNIVQLEILPGIFSNARNSRCSMPSSPTYSTLSDRRRSKSSSRSLLHMGSPSPPPLSPPRNNCTLKRNKDNLRRKFVTFTVELQRENGGPLGLTLATEDDADICGPIFISGLVENGLAERTKTIQMNDQVVEINGCLIQNKSLNEVVPLLQSSNNLVKLKLARLISIPERDFLNNGINSGNGSNNYSNNNNGNTNGNSNNSNLLRSNSAKLLRKPPLPSPAPTPKSGINTVSLLTPLLSRASPSPVRPVPMEVHKITLFKDKVYEDFGFSVSDGLYDKGIYVNRIRKGGPAHSCELLQPFDRILQINDTRTYDFDCCLAVPLIASAGDKIELLVTRNTGPPPEIKDYDGYSSTTSNGSGKTTVTANNTLKKEDIIKWMQEKEEDSNSINRTNLRS